MTACAILGGKEGRSFADGNNNLNKCGSQHGGFALRSFLGLWCLTLEFAVALASNDQVTLKSRTLHCMKLRTFKRDIFDFGKRGQTLTGLVVVV